MGKSKSSLGWALGCGNRKRWGENERYWNPHGPFMPARLWHLGVPLLVQEIYGR